MRQVHADLVGAPGLKLDAHEGMRAQALENAKMRDRGAPIGAHGHAGALASVPADRLIDRAAARHDARTERHVPAANLPGRERRHQRRVRLGCARHEQEPARILVEPVHDPGGS